RVHQVDGVDECIGALGALARSGGVDDQIGHGKTYGRALTVVLALAVRAFRSMIVSRTNWLLRCAFTAPVRCAGPSGSRRSPRISVFFIVPSRMSTDVVLFPSSSITYPAPS